MLFLGCDSKEMSEIHDIETVRVISIRADLPEAHPGDEVTIDHLIGKPEGDTSEYQQIWAVCDPGPLGESQFGATMCSQNPSLDNMLVVQTTNEDTMQFTIPGDTLSTFKLESKYLYILHGLCVNTKANCDKLVAEMTENGALDFSKIKLSVKRIRVIKSDQAITNTNPQFDRIYLDDDPIYSDTPLQLAPDKYSLKASVTTASFEQKPDPEGKMVDERITFYWSSNGANFTKGTLADQKRDELLDDFDTVKFKITEETNNLPYTLYLVVMDERGGVNWKTFTVEKK